MKRKHKSKRKIMISLIVLAVIVIAFILVLSMINILNANSNSNKASLNANVIGNEDSNVLPRHIFYHSPRVFENPKYSSSCFPSGEIMYALPGNKCCAGLKELMIIDEAEPNCKILSGGSICSDCGNTKCEYGENLCNCPKDCKI